MNERSAHKEYESAIVVMIQSTSTKVAFGTERVNILDIIYSVGNKIVSIIQTLYLQSSNCLILTNLINLTLSVPNAT